MSSSNQNQLSPTLASEEKTSEKKNLDVTMMWDDTVVGVQRISAGQKVEIGDSLKAHFQIAHAAIPSTLYTLVEMTPAGAKVHPTAGMSVTLDKNAVANSGTMNIAPGQQICVTVGNIKFVIQYAKKYLPLAGTMSTAMDYFASKIAAMVLIIQLGFIIAFYFAPQISLDDEDDLMAEMNDFEQLLLTQEEKKIEKPEEISGKKAGAHKDDEGLFGKKDKPKEDKAASKDGAPTVDKDKREEDRKIAFDALASLGLTGAGETAVSNTFGPGGLGGGENTALGGLKGAGMGEAGGAGGLGGRGAGAGGGGNGLGIGGIGSGTGRGTGGNGSVNLGGRGKGRTKVKVGKVRFKGSLTKDEIERVLKRAERKIRRCYDKEVAKDPNLKGKIVPQWVIQGNGRVSGAKSSQNTMGNKQVESCVIKVIGRLTFPKPRGGGTVFVSYPYMFSL